MAAINTSHHLVDLLYKLEKDSYQNNLHILAENLSLINHHEKILERYRANVKLRSQTGNTDVMSVNEQDQFYRTLTELHIKTMQQHEEFKKRYSEEMEEFR